MGTYGANTNWANEEKYLNNLIAGGGGNADWAKNQMNELNAAKAEYSKQTTPSGGNTVNASTNNISLKGGSSGGSSGGSGAGLTVRAGASTANLSGAVADRVRQISADRNVDVGVAYDMYLNENGIPHSVGYSTPNYGGGSGVKQETGLADAQRAEYEDIIAQLRAQYEGQNSQYAQALAQQRAAQEAAVQKAVNGLEAQKGDVDSAYSDMYRQAYINKMLTQKNLDQRLAAQGITGGAAESTMLGLDTSYADALRKAEQGRIGAIRDIDQAIEDARLTGDIESANATADTIKEQTDRNASVLQSLLDRYDTINARQEAYDRADAENTQSWARQVALQMLNQGVMPDDDTLSSAGMTAAQAQALMPQVATYTPTFSQAQVLNAAKQGTLTGAMLRDYNYYMYGDPDYSDTSASASSVQAAPARSTGGTGYNNGGLSNDAVAKIQNFFGLEGDGYWGPNSQATTQYSSAAQAQQAMNSILGTLDEMKRKGADWSQLLQAIHDAQDTGVIPQAAYRSLYNYISNLNRS